MAIYLPSIRQPTQASIMRVGASLDRAIVFEVDRAGKRAGVTTTQEIAALKSDALFAQANHVATSSYRKRAMFRVGTPEEKSSDRDRISAAEKTLEARTLFSRACLPSNAANQRFHHEFFLHAQWLLLVKQACNLIKRVMRFDWFPHAPQARASGCSRFGFQPAIDSSAQASCQWQHRFR